MPNDEAVQEAAPEAEAAAPPGPDPEPELTLKQRMAIAALHDANLEKAKEREKAEAAEKKRRESRFHYSFRGLAPDVDLGPLFAKFTKELEAAGVELHHSGGLVGDVGREKPIGG